MIAWEAAHHLVAPQETVTVRCWFRFLPIEVVGAEVLGAISEG